MKVPGMHLYPCPLQGRGQYELEVPGHTPRVGSGVSRDLHGPPHSVGTTSASCLTFTREGLFQVRLTPLETRLDGHPKAAFRLTAPASGW